MLSLSNSNSTSQIFPLCGSMKSKYVIEYGQEFKGNKELKNGNCNLNPEYCKKITFLLEQLISSGNFTSLPCHLSQEN